MSTTDNTSRPDDNATPLVSVIVRSIGRSQLCEALDSIALQTYPNIEVVLVNARGPDHRPLDAWCGRFPVRVCATDGSLGRSCAANLGLDSARGDFLIFLDDDDWFMPEHVAQLVEALSRAHSARAAYAGVKCARRVQGGTEWEQIHAFNEPFDDTRLLCENYLPIHAVLFARSLLKEGCRFDENLDIYEDWDFWIQVSLRSEFVHIDRVSAVYCISDSGGFGVTGDQDVIAQSRARLFDKWKHLWNDKQVVALIDLAKSGFRTGQLIEDNSRQAQQIERQKALIERQKALIERQKALIEKSAEREGGLNQVVAERDRQIAGIYRSHSWRLTRPLRVLRRLVGRLRDSELLFARNASGFVRGENWRQGLAGFARRALFRLSHSFFRGAISVYRTLPIAPVKKQKLKHTVFRVFGFAFVRLDAYQHWKAYQQIQTNWPSTASAVSGAIATIPSANGAWEWSDYSVVKSRISQIKASRRLQVLPSLLDLVDIDNEPFASAAARVNFPPLVAAPDVSIILPVFNNLKLTLECLLSISAHSNSSVSFEIIVADDASTDETAQVIGSIPNLRIIRNESNLGFLRNCNHALEHVKGNYVLYLNNDVQVTAGWLNTLLDTFNSFPNVGVVGPRFIYPNGLLQEAGAVFHPDGTVDMVGLNEDPSQARFSYTRRVDYVSGACLMLPTPLAKQLGGFSEDYLPCYCEDSDLCLRVQEIGYYVYCNPAATIVHHLSKTTGTLDTNFKLRSVSKNLVTLQNKWLHRLDRSIDPKVIAFYLPQFHPFPENDKWWGGGFTEWVNVTKAQPNFVGHYQPRLPADLGFYDLRLPEVMLQQAELARRYGVHGFCFHYYWFGGKRLLDRPIEQMLATGKPDFPFCLCWANENWTRRWDGQEHEVLMAQLHSPEDDDAVISDLIRFFRDGRYIRIDGRPLILVYRVTIFPNFSETAERWRVFCRKQGIGEIYIAMAETFDLVHANTHPNVFGCDAAVEFPPHGCLEQKKPAGAVINPEYEGSVADYRDLALRCATRELPPYTRFMGVVPGWDNTARRKNNGFCFEYATPGAFQAWMEEAIDQTRAQHYGDERLVFVNAWNEWAEGAYIEPDRRFGHTYLEAVKNASEAARLLRKDRYGLGG